MNDEDDILFDKQVKLWLETYDRLFGDEDSIEEQKRKLARLKKIREGWKLHHELLDKLIDVREKRLP